MTTASTAEETFALPLDALTEAAVRLSFGGGELTVHAAPPGMLIAGTFQGGVVHKSTGPGKVELEPLAPERALLAGRPLYWDVGLSAEIPVDLRLDSGANRSAIDLSTLRIRSLELQTGASETRVRLPAAGQTAVHVACGFAAVIVDVPQGVAARIRGKVTLGSTEVDEARFPRTETGWASPGYETASDRVDIAVEGGFGSVRIA